MDKDLNVGHNLFPSWLKTSSKDNNGSVISSISDSNSDTSIFFKSNQYSQNSNIKNENYVYNNKKFDSSLSSKVFNSKFNNIYSEDKGLNNIKYNNNYISKYTHPSRGSYLNRNPSFDNKFVKNTYDYSNYYNDDKIYNNNTIKHSSLHLANNLNRLKLTSEISSKIYQPPQNYESNISHERVSYANNIKPWHHTNLSNNNTVFANNYSNSYNNNYGYSNNYNSRNILNESTYNSVTSAPYKFRFNKPILNSGAYSQTNKNDFDDSYENTNTLCNGTSTNTYSYNNPNNVDNGFGVKYTEWDKNNYNTSKNGYNYSTSYYNPGTNNHQQYYKNDWKTNIVNNISNGYIDNNHSSWNNNDSAFNNLDGPYKADDVLKYSTPTEEHLSNDDRYQNNNYDKTPNEAYKNGDQDDSRDDSLEAEHKLLKAMGWNGSAFRDVEPLSRDEVEEFFKDTANKYGTSVLTNNTTLSSASTQFFNKR
ncbi:unnamed protein product [Gordionus sp. m RMFG-2023]|uniref:probable serine/threonine-protein kinase clkA n=1 Tax=Gordionus sp. m RMFG-2023 TaxID=3053472 RepID=UPI0030E10351